MTKFFFGFLTCILTVAGYGQWVQTNGPDEGYVNCFGVSPNGADGTNLFAGTQGAGVFLSTNNGISWTEVNTGLPMPTDVVTSFEVSGSNVFAGTIGGVFRTTNNGASWTTAAGGLTPTAVNALAIEGSNLFAGTNGNGVFLSTNNGAGWHRVNTGLADTTVMSLAVVPNGTGGSNLLAGTLGGGVFLTTDNGTSWTSSGLPYTTVEAFAVGDTNIFASTFYSGVFLSTDYGSTWSAVNSGLPPYSESVSEGALAAVPKGAGGLNLFAGTFGNGVYLSTDKGTSWTPMNTGFVNTDINGLVVSGANIFAGTNFGSDIFRSTDNGSSWMVIDSGLTLPISSAEAFAVIPNGIGGTNTFAGTSNGVFLSTNDGNNWTEVNTGLPGLLYRTVNSLAVVGTNLFAAIGAGTATNGVYLSTDNGTSWNHTNISLTTSSVNVLLASPNGTGGTNLFVGTLGAGVYVTTDNGANWIPADSGMTNARINCFTTIPNGSGGVILFAGSTSGVYRSTDNGTYWTLVDSGLGNTDINALAASDKDLFAGTVSGIYSSTNQGKSWSSFNTGLPKDPLLPIYPTIKALAVNGSDLLAGTFFLGVWKRPLTQITSVKPSSNGIPVEMKLEQNYPNPFNPTTTISFALSKSSFVAIKIYNILGQIVSTILNERRGPGTYNVEFDGSNLPSGVYFYRLTAGEFTQAKKMVVIR